MWFVYIQGHGITEHDDADELLKDVALTLQYHQADAITVIEGRDVTSDVIQDLEGSTP